MTDVLVQCIITPTPQSQHEHITHLGGKGGGGWCWPKAIVIKTIELKINTFYVLDPETGKRAEVEVVRPMDGSMPFLRTQADGTWNDSLLLLPQCQPSAPSQARMTSL